MAETDSTTRERRRPPVRLPVWICLITTVVAVNTWLQIEWWNYRAGGLLPRDTHAPGNPKWREAADRSIRAKFQRQINMEEFERIIAQRGRVTAEEELALETNPRPLTAAEQNALLRELDQSRANSALRAWVQTGGIAQYVVAPSAFIMALVLLVRAAGFRAHFGLGVLAVLSGVAVGMMLYRGYFTSLGW